jgi:hypothetical protein
MKKLSLAKRIENYLRKHPDTFFNGGEIERLSMSAGYKASNGSRRCREMVEEGILERKEEKGSVWYRYVPKEKTALKTNIIETPEVRAAQLQEVTLFQ